MRVSSVGLKVIGRETVENLLFLENLFLPQELSKVPPNPRFAERKLVMNWMLELGNMYLGIFMLEKRFWLSYHYATDDTNKRMVDNGYLGGQDGRKRELAMSGNSSAPDETWLSIYNTQYTIHYTWFYCAIKHNTAILQHNRSQGIFRSGSGARLFLHPVSWGGWVGGFTVVVNIFFTYIGG